MVHPKKLLVISYSHAFAQRLDVKKLVDRLDHLGVSDFAEVWWDYEIPSGSGWDNEIRTKFENADAYFILASNAYIESNYIVNVEWPIIQRRVTAGTAALFWTSFDRPAGSYTHPVNLSPFQTAAKRSAPLIEADQKKKGDFLNQLAEDIATFLVDSGGSLSQTTNRPRRQPTPREVEAAYIEALNNQCASLVNNDRFLPMQQLYVRLKADERTTEERKAGEELMQRRIRSDIAGENMETSKKTANEIIENQLKKLTEVEQLPIEASVKFATTHFSDDSLEDIFQRNRFIVVRGGPGTGKTVLCWKISETLSAGWREEYEQRPIRTIRKMTEFGVSRLPVLIPIRDYAKACREHHGDLGLAGFIGNHLSREDPANAPYFNQFLLDLIEKGRVVLLLDGLDEVPAMDRHQIVESIKAFLRIYINPTLGHFTGDPGDIGGNQIVITSRIAGYELAPITDEAFRHFIIRPFDEKGIEEFCRHWAKMVFSRRTPNHGALADELVGAILRNSSPTVQELAKNPLLLQVLCELAAPVEISDETFPVDRLHELPRIRAEIYDRAITVMAKRWKVAYDSVAEKNEYVRRLLEPGKMEELLSYVALEMQREEILTRASREQLTSWLELALGKVERKSMLSIQPGEVSRTISALLDLVRTHVGVISESAPGVFQFHHLTFQEYLAGKASCRSYNGKNWETAENLGQRMASGETGLLNQRWREPFLLAFGHLGTTAKYDASTTQSMPQPMAVLQSLQKAWKNPDSNATPEEAALLIVSLLLELPDNLVINLLDQAMRDIVACYKTWFESGVLRETSNLFVEALAKLRRRLSIQMEAGGVNPFDSIAAHIIENISELSAPLGRIFVDRGWLTPMVLSAFAKARVQDNETWNWPIHQGLRRAVLNRDDLEPKARPQLEMPDASSKIQEKINYDHALDAWREQRRMDAERVLRPRLTSPPRIQALLSPTLNQVRKWTPAVLRRVIALCGGFYDFQCGRWQKEYADFSNFLYQLDSIRDNRISEEPEAFIPRWGAINTVYEMAVYLDKKQDGRGLLATESPYFDIQSIAHDPSDMMLRILEESLNFPVEKETRVVKLLQQLAATEEAIDIAAEAWVALLASGQASQLPENGDVVDRIKWHCSRILDELRDPVIRFAHTGGNKTAEDDHRENLWTVLNRWLPSLPESEALTVFSLVMQALTEATGEPVEPGLIWEGDAMSPMKLALWGESWAAALSGRDEDPVNNLAVALNTLKFAAEPTQVYRQCQAIMDSANMRFVANAHDGLLTPMSFESNLSAIDHFCSVIQFLCETAGTFNQSFRARLFNKITSGLFKMPGHTPLMFMVLAEYLGAPGEEHFGITPEAFKTMLEKSMHANRLEYSLPDGWKLADLLSLGLSETTSKFESHLDVVLHLCGLDEVSESDGWKAFSIFLAANVARKSNNRLESQDDLWRRLLSDVQKDAVTLPETMATFIARAGNGGLTINETAAQQIEAIALIDSKAARAVLSCVLPLVSHTTPSEIIRLRSWIRRNWHSDIPFYGASSLAEHAALIMAEHSAALEAGWIQPLLSVAFHGDDRSRSRAILTLGGPIGNVKRGTRHRSVSAIGFDTLKNMIDSYFDGCHRTGNNKLFTRCFDDLHFDQPEVAIWLKDLPHPTLANTSALPYLFGFGTWTEESLETFTTCLAAEPALWSDSFIIGYGCLLYYQEESIPKSLHDLMQQLITSHKVTAHCLPEKESYGLVVEASLQAIADGTKVPYQTAAAILKTNCEWLSSGAPIEGFDVAYVCSSLAESLMQWFDTSPEDCWPDIASRLGDDRLFDLIFNWLVKELKDWSARRTLPVQPTDSDQIFSESLQNALLAILCVMTEQKRDEFLLLTTNLEQKGVLLSVLLSEAAIHHRRRVARMAAITLLSRLSNLDANEVSKVVQAALNDDESIRNRALLLLPKFRDFKVTTAFIDDALERLTSYQPASITLSYATLLTNLLSTNIISNTGKHREIMNALRKAASDFKNIRVLAHIAGSGSDTSPRGVVKDGRLDQALLGVMAKSYSNFFKSV